MWLWWIVCGIFSQLPFADVAVVVWRLPACACIISLLQLYAGYVTADHALHRAIPKFTAWWADSRITQYRVVQRVLTSGGYGMLFTCGANPVSYFPFTLIPGYPCHWQGIVILRTTHLRYGAVVLCVGATIRIWLLYFWAEAIMAFFWNVVSFFR